MRTFDCPCGNRLYFENTRCMTCGRDLGYLPDLQRIAVIEETGSGLWAGLTPDGPAGDYRKCANYTEPTVCNWMVPAGETAPYCHACRLNEIIPDQDVSENRLLWRRIEQAKRRLVFTLDLLGLPVFGKSVDPARGLAFRFLRDASSDTDEFASDSGGQSILTGHNAGTITINIAEADPGARERMREKMNEAYRTLLGHFRHECGHYYWDLLVRDSEMAEPSRALFGDERADYESALQHYYAEGPAPDWASRHISAYAAAHPLEDWAESWAHYLHMADTLETAADEGLEMAGHALRPMTPGDDARFDDALSDWNLLTRALNSLNRSMGQPDAYPFAINATVAAKLRLIDTIVANAGCAPAGAIPSRSAAAPKGPA